jgi:hypothetical protein
MYTKVLTVDCPSCNCLFIDDFSNFRCNWGKAKKGKLLLPHKGKRPKFECKLNRAKESCA